MHVEVISTYAALDGRENVVWSGEVDLPDTINPPDDPADDVNEALFRLFNRASDADAERLSGMNYRLPSLSAGDFVVWEETAYQVLSVGFEQATSSPTQVRASVEAVAQAMRRRNSIGGPR